MKKRLLSTVLTGAVLAGTMIFPAAVQAETTLSEAVNLYADALSEHTKDSYYYFALAYIDEDTVPELLVAENSAHVSGVTCYFYKNNTLVSDSIPGGSFGEASFSPKNNIVWGNWSGMGAYIDTFAKWSGSQFTEIKGFKYDSDYFNPDDIVYTVDSGEVSAETYKQQRNEFVNSYTWLKFNENNSFKITASNISDMQANPKKYILGYDGISVYLDGGEIEFDQEPVILEGRTMVPLRAIFEAMGYSVNWDQTTQTAEAVKCSDSITVQLNNSVINYTLNGEANSYICDTVPQAVNGRTLVPVRAIAECAGCEVNWDSGSKTVTITS